MFQIKLVILSYLYFREMKVLAVFLALVVAIQATPLKELVRELLELSGMYKGHMVYTKNVETLKEKKNRYGHLLICGLKDSSFL